jgi:hypothetical protein
MHEENYVKNVFNNIKIDKRTRAFQQRKVIPLNILPCKIGGTR